MIDRPHNRGFTFPELIISMAIVLTIFAFAGINLLRIIPRSSITEISGSFMADAKSQQHNAMLGESDSLVQIDYSIKVDETSYTLFKGQVYVPGAPTNYTVEYPENIIANTGLPETADGVITFSSISGEIKNFNSEHPEYYRVTFSGLYNNQTTIRFNKLGNVYYVNSN